MIVFFKTKHHTDKTILGLTICSVTFMLIHLQKNIVIISNLLGILMNNLYIYIYTKQKSIDDILLVFDDENQMLTIKNKLTENSVLSFTHEHFHNKLEFLDVACNEGRQFANFCLCESN